jgi:hypothetical protein
MHDFKALQKATLETLSRKSTAGAAACREWWIYGPSCEFYPQYVVEQTTLTTYTRLRH